MQTRKTYLKASLYFALSLSLSLLLPLLSYSAEIAPSKGKTKKITIFENGKEESWYLILKNNPLEFTVKSRGTIAIEARSLVSKKRRRADSYVVRIDINGESAKYNIPALYYKKGLKFKGLRRTVPTTKVGLAEIVKSGKEVHNIKIISPRTALIRIVVKPLRQEESPSVVTKKSFRSTTTPIYSIGFFAGPLYYSSSNSFRNPGLNLNLSGEYRIFEKLSLKGKIGYMFYRAGYLYADYSKRAFTGLEVKGLFVNESRLTIDVLGAFKILSKGILSLSVEGGYTGGYFINSVYNYNYQGIKGQGTLKIGLGKGEIQTGAGVSIPIGGTSYIASLEGTPSGYIIEVPVLYSIPLSKGRLNLEAGYSFEYVNYEQGGRFYNTLILSISI